MRRLLALAIFIALLLASAPLAARENFPTFVAPGSMYSEPQVNTLQRDADLAQRSGVPIMFVAVQGDGTSAGSAQRFADQYRAEYGVETSEGADDGIVFLLHWVPSNPAASTVVYSAGEHAFETTGLSDATITAYITEHVEPWFERDQPFEAMVYLMRFTRYTSLYVPPPVQEVTGFAQTVQQVLTFAAPVLAIGSIASLWRIQNPSNRTRYRMVGLTLAGALVLAALSVWTQNRIGIASIAVALVSLAVWCLWVTRDREREPIQWSSILPDIGILLVVVLVSLSINMNQVEITPGDRDETRWINRAYYAADLVDPFGPTWQDYTITVGQPPLGSIAMGVGMWIQGEPLRDVGVWDYQYGRDWYLATGMNPSEETTHTARRTSAVIGALTTGAVYVLGRLLTNRVGGLAAAAYVAWHPLHIVLSTQALSDETFVLMLVLALIAAWRFATKPTWTSAIVLGILLGLGGAAKLTPLLLAPPLVVFGIVRLWFDRTEEGRRAGWMLIAQPFIAFAAFVAIYPFLWANPIERTWRLFSFRSSEMDAQTSAWPQSLTAGPFAALEAFGHKLTYTHSTSQKALQHLYDWMGIERTAVGFDLVFAAAGAVILLWIVARNGLWTPQALVGCLLLGELALLAIGMKADFYRYHLPVVMIAAACISVFAGTAWSWGLALVQSGSQQTQTSTSAEVATQ